MHGHDERQSDQWFLVERKEEEILGKVTKGWRGSFMFEMFSSLHPLADKKDIKQIWQTIKIWQSW